jgi:hypothetical protein
VRLLKPIMIATATGIAAASLAACGSSSTSAESAAAEAPSTPSAAASETVVVEEKSADCLTVDASMADAIVSGAQDGTGMKAVEAAAVKSPDFENVYFIAVKFSATGVDDQVGVWASNSLTPGGGLILSASSMAKQFTDWPDGATTDAQISAADPSIAAAEACLS